MNKEMVVGGSVLFLAVIGMWWAYTTPVATPADAIVVERSNPTNFIARGVVTMNNPGQVPEVPYLVYEAPGAPALAKKLSFDLLSVCGVQNASGPCAAMSVSAIGESFGGKAVIVEGELVGSDTVLVRKMQTTQKGQDSFPLSDTGNVFVSWPEAMTLLEECRVTMVFQTHSLDVILDLDDETQVRTVAPMIDEVFSVIDSTREVCGVIPVATE